MESRAFRQRDPAAARLRGSVAFNGNCWIRAIVVLVLAEDSSVGNLGEIYLNDSTDRHVGTHGKLWNIHSRWNFSKNWTDAVHRGPCRRVMQLQQ